MAGVRELNDKSSRSNMRNDIRIILSIHRNEFTLDAMTMAYLCGLWILSAMLHLITQLIVMHIRSQSPKQPLWRLQLRLTLY